MNTDEIVDDLRQASSKLDYLVSLRDDSDTNKHRQAILFKYISEIKESIAEVSEKITEAYDAISDCEMSDDSNDSSECYLELYSKLVEEAKKERKFIDDFGMSMMMWHMLT